MLVHTWIKVFNFMRTAFPSINLEHFSLFHIYCYFYQTTTHHLLILIVWIFCGYNLLVFSLYTLEYCSRHIYNSTTCTTSIVPPDARITGDIFWQIQGNWSTRGSFKVYFCPCWSCRQSNSSQVTTEQQSEVPLNPGIQANFPWSGVLVHGSVLGLIQDHECITKGNFIPQDGAYQCSFFLFHHHIIASMTNNVWGQVWLSCLQTRIGCANVCSHFQHSCPKHWHPRYC